MTRRPILTTMAAACALALSAYAQTAMRPAPLEAERHLPAGKTLAFVSISDLASAEAAFQTTDLGQVWKQLEPFRAELEKGLDFSMSDLKAEFEKEAGVKLEDALRALKDGLAVAVVDMAGPDAPEPEPGFALALGKGHKATVERVLLKAFPPDRQQGQPPVVLAERGNALFVLQNGYSLAAPGTKALADDPGYQQLQARLVGQGGAPFFTFYANIEAAVARVLRSDPEGAERLGKAGALDVTALGLAIGFQDGRMREAIVARAAGERRGFAKVLASGAPLDVAALAQAAPPDLLSFAALRLDARAMVDQAIEVVRSLEPAAADDLERGIAELDQELQMKLRDDLLSPLGDTVALETFIPEDGFLPESVVVLAPRDPQRVEAAIGKLMARGGLSVKTVERAGKKIRYFQAPLGKVGTNPTEGRDEEAMAFSTAALAFAGAYLVEGGKIYLAALPQTLEDRIERTARGTLAADPAFQAALARTPQGARLFAWTRTRPFAGIVYHGGLRLLRVLEPFIRGAGVPVDTALLPRPGAIARPMQPATSTFVVDAEGFQFLSQGGVPVASLVPVIAAVAVPSFLEQRERAEQARVQVTLRQLHTAQQLFQMDKGAFATSIDELTRGGYLAGRPAAPGYAFAITKVEGPAFLIEARPQDPRKPHLIVDESGFVRRFGEPNPFASEPAPEPEQGQGQDRPDGSGEGEGEPEPKKEESGEEKE